MDLTHFKDQPFVSHLDGENELPFVAWTTAENACEFRDGETGACDTTGIYYGTADSREPVFCARHFYQEAVGGDGCTGYALRDAAPAAPTEGEPGRTG